MPYALFPTQPAILHTTFLSIIQHPASLVRRLVHRSSSEDGSFSEGESNVELVIEWAEGPNVRDLVLDFDFWKSTMVIRKARTRFTYKLFLTLLPIETETKVGYLLNLAKACLPQNTKLAEPQQKGSAVI